LYRLRSAINRLLDDPQKISEVKRHFQPDDEVEYFAPEENRLIQARLIKFQRTRVVVRNLEDGVVWEIPYYALNIHGVETHISEHRQQGLGRNEVAVGDQVGFIDRKGRDRFGQVIRLNQKTVTLDCDDSTWRVAYELLFPVLDANIVPARGVLSMTVESAPPKLPDNRPDVSP